MRLSVRVLSLFLASILFIGSASSSLAQTAESDDTDSIGAILTATYDAISGAAGERRDWDRFRSLFAAGATLSYVSIGQAGETSRTVMTPDEYIERSGASLERNGFFETEINRKTERFGNIAHVFSSYESRRKQTDPAPFARGINSFQLMYDGERWYVVSIFWQAETEQAQIPPEYLP